MTDKPFFELGAKEGKGIPPISKGSPFLGLAVLVTPGSPENPSAGTNQFARLNYTGPPGSCSNLYYSVVFGLSDMGFHVVKVDEWISVSPEHVEYHRIVTEQKKQLETTIKSGLAYAAQAVADYELLKHDLRKYEEFLSYFRKGDDRVLRSIFIDQVDVHTDLPNSPTALKSIVSRWPTIIADFMKLTDEDTDPDKIAEKLNVSKAEATILSVKNRLYLEWKHKFGKTVEERYKNLQALVNSRKKSVEEYKKWIRPYLTRFKMMKFGEETPGFAKNLFKSFFDIVGQATFSNAIKIWAWQPFRVSEPRKMGIEKEGGFLYPPNDEFVVNKFIKHPKTGLARIYPWLLEKKNGKTVADEIIDEVLSEWTALGCDPDELYYVFIELDIERCGLWTRGGEIEDITFDIKTYFMSQNILLVKLVELKCRERELERYLDEILGLTEGKLPEPKKEEPKPTGFLAELKGTVERIKKPFTLEKRAKAPVLFFKKGIYERDFSDRITQFYLKEIGINYFGKLKGFILQKMGVA
ncbi:MAG: hypothetical protein GXO63_02060 [Candidatus Micrarchaeota archaeon]|nr:hypothetical protein [Candidatus Micrarchaeota archaeon]